MVRIEGDGPWANRWAPIDKFTQPQPDTGAVKTETEGQIASSGVIELANPNESVHVDS